MSVIGSGPGRRPVGLHHRIAEAELRSTAATRALSDLIQAEADTSEAERRLNGELDRLLVLRRQLAELLMFGEVGGIPPIAPVRTGREA